MHPSTPREHIHVTSSLAGLRVAPAHVHWVADPSFKRQDVREVRFYVDGKLSWIDPEKPYTYGGDGGFLVTSWLADIADSGAHAARFTRHTFTTEAVAVDGSQAREEVVLRVRSLKHMPNLPYGIWGRPVGGPPWPRAIDVLSPGVLWIGAPIEHATAYEVEADGGTLRILAPIRKGPGGDGRHRAGMALRQLRLRPRRAVCRLPVVVRPWRHASAHRRARSVRGPQAEARGNLGGPRLSLRCWGAGTWRPAPQPREDVEIYDIDTSSSLSSSVGLIVEPTTCLRMR
ncbi:MAG TPA: hypothetical protein VLB81_03670 [Gaiellales bacterium]|nr:hypothetical protein [Gaiellales bacterium]